MAERLYEVEWECISCSRSHRFRHGLGEFDDWPNKFEDLKCENPDCPSTSLRVVSLSNHGQVQDVRFQNCTVTEVSR